MKSTGTPEPLNRFSYRIDFKYKKFEDNLKATDPIKSFLTITMNEPVPEPMLTHWTTIIREMNPNYFGIEIIDVKEIKV